MSAPEVTRPPQQITVQPYAWKIPDGSVERGYRIRKGKAFLWLRPQEAYEVCCGLADLLDDDNRKDAHD